MDVFVCAGAVACSCGFVFFAVFICSCGFLFLTVFICRWITSAHGNEPVKLPNMVHFSRMRVIFRVQEDESGKRTVEISKIRNLGGGERFQTRVWGGGVQPFKWGNA